MPAKMIDCYLRPNGKLWNIAFGFAQIADGLVRVVSLGNLHTRFALEVSKAQVKADIRRMKGI